MKRLPSFAATLVFVIACSNQDSDAQTPNDVRTACNNRSTWTRATTKRCIECTAAAKLQECQCPGLEEFAAKCVDQHTAVLREPTCTDALDQCVVGCKNDCGCVDACYARAPNCQSKAGERDGCVVSACTAVCR
ncbi:MAG: hypothetical protein U0174_26070 [Polyangiaceae bacterium]